MRSFLVFAIFLGLGGLYLWQKHNGVSEASATQPAVISHSTPVPSATVSEHDWMKRSLDRAGEVARDARRQTQEAQQP